MYEDNRKIARVVRELGMPKDIPPREFSYAMQLYGHGHYRSLLGLIRLYNTSDKPIRRSLLIQFRHWLKMDRVVRAASPFSGRQWEVVRTNITDSDVSYRLETIYSKLAKELASQGTFSF